MRSVVSATVAALLATVLVGCSADREGDPAPPSGTGPAQVAPPTPVVAPGDLWWRVAATSPSDHPTLAFHGDAAVSVGGPDDRRLVRVVDADTGRVRWQQRVGATLPGAGGLVLWRASAALGDDDDSPVVVAGHRFSCLAAPTACRPFSDGVAALDVDDGSARWTWGADGLSGRLHDRRGVYVDPVAVADGLVVVGVRNDADSFTVALDVGTGEQVWARRGGLPQYVDSGLVLTSTPGADAAQEAARVLSLADGATRWSVPRGTAVSGVVKGLVATTATGPGGGPVTDIRDLASGEVRASTAALVSDGEAPGAGTMMAWTDDGVLSTMTAADRAQYEAPVGDDLGYEYTAGELVVGPRGTVDRLGHPVESLDGLSPVSYDDERLVVRTGGGPRGGYAVYRRLG